MDVSLAELGRRALSLSLGVLLLYLDLCYLGPQLLFACIELLELLFSVELQLAELLLQPLVLLAEVHEAYVELAHLLELALLRGLAFGGAQTKVLVPRLQIIVLRHFELQILLEYHVGALERLHLGGVRLLHVRSFTLLLLVSQHAFLYVVPIQLIPQILDDDGVLVLLLLVHRYGLLKRFEVLPQISELVLEAVNLLLLLLDRLLISRPGILLGRK